MLNTAVMPVQLVALQELEVHDGERTRHGKHEQQHEVAVGDAGDDEHHQQHHAT